jgi:subfamily B ATP-binding cassette protein MsbA
MGKPGASDEEVVSSLKKANAYDFLMKHEAGINLNAGAAGNQISGGQK